MKKLFGLFLFITTVSFFSCNTSDDDNGEKTEDRVPATMTLKLKYVPEGNLLDLLDLELHYYFTGKSENNADNPIVEKFTSKTFEKEFKNQAMDAELNYKIIYKRNEVAVDPNTSYDFIFTVYRFRTVYNAGGEIIDEPNEKKAELAHFSGLKHDKIQTFIDSRNKLSYSTLSKSTM